MELLLASASPRRAELLKQYGIPFTIRTVEVEELDSASDIRLLPQLNAALKADAASEFHPGKAILAADTMIIFEDRAIGKPGSTEEAKEMLRLFSGKTHEVITGVALVCRNRQLRRIWSETSRVTFKELSAETIDRYIREVNVLDKAGAYAIQEHSELIIENYSGELANIIGLPLKRLMNELQQWEIS